MSLYMVIIYKGKDYQNICYIKMIVNSMHWKYFFTPILKCFLVQIKEVNNIKHNANINDLMKIIPFLCS